MEIIVLKFIYKPSTLPMCEGNLLLTFTLEI